MIKPPSCWISRGSARIESTTSLSRDAFLGGGNVHTIIPDFAKRPIQSIDLRNRPQAAGAGPVTITSSNGSAAGIAARMAAPSDLKGRRLIADQQYLGLDAKTLRGGAARTLARLSSHPAGHAWIDLRNLGDDFHLDAVTCSALLSAMLAGGLLYPVGAGRYQPTRQFREYALATIVSPLPRDRAKGLLDRACKVAARINTEWNHIPFQIEMMAVSGSYMTRRDQLSDLALSLALHRRPVSRGANAPIPPGKDEASRQIIEALQALSSFIVVRIVADQTKVQRPFSVVFQGGANAPETAAERSSLFRDWGSSVSRWFAAK
jgi:hypothetical protein